MDMSGERRIAAPRQAVWNALNDTEILKSCIPGCESLVRSGENDLKATAAVKIGPISARFSGVVHLTDLDPPNSYRISGEGQGGVAGFAKGGADVHLADDGADTLLSYVVKAQVGGKMAQLGARLIEATSKQMADLFFDRFTAIVAAPVVLEQSAVPVTSAAHRPVPVKLDLMTLLKLIPPAPLGVPLFGWLGILAYPLVAVLLIGFPGFLLYLPIGFLLYRKYGRGK